MSNYKSFYIYLFFLMGIPFCLSVPAQNNAPKQQSVIGVKDFSQRVSAEKAVTYLELIRKVFPANPSRIPLTSWAGNGPGFDITAQGSIPLRDLKIRSGPRIQHNYPLRIIEARSIILDEDQNHIALIIHAEPVTQEKNQAGFYAVAVFNLAPQPKLLEAFDSQNWQMLNFRNNFSEESWVKREREDEYPVDYESENEAQFLITGESLTPSATWSHKYILFGLKNNTVQVISDDLPIVETQKVSGYKETTEILFYSYMTCGQENYYRGQLVYKYIINETWDVPDNSSEPKPPLPRKREREYTLYWNPHLGHYQKRFERDETSLLGSYDEHTFKSAPGFQGFSAPRTLKGKPIFLNQVYEVSLYGGDEKGWYWEGDLSQPPRNKILMDWGFGYGSPGYDPHSYGERRLDIRFVIIGISRERKDDGSWTNTYECKVIDTAER